MKNLSKPIKKQTEANEDNNLNSAVDPKQAENSNNIANNLGKINPMLESKKSNKVADLELNFRKIPITSSNQIKQVKTYFRESLQEHLDLIKKPEIIKLLEKDLNEDERETLKITVESIPDDMLEKLSKKISNIYKWIKKIIKQTTEVDKKAKLKKLITDKEELDKDLELKAEEKVDHLIKLAEKEKTSFNFTLDSVNRHFENYCKNNSLDIAEQEDNILIKKYDANSREHLIKHTEVADYLISNHNKNAENMQKNLLLKFDLFTKERLEIEANYVNLYDCLDIIEKKNNDLSVINKIQNNKDNKRVNLLKKYGIFV